MADQNISIAEHVAARNESKLLFTAGPASLLPANLSGLRPCFGRGDADYAAVEESVLAHLRAMSGHDRIVRLQGSASLALEIMSRNFLFGRLLVVSTGYYSERMSTLALSAQRQNPEIQQVDCVSHSEIAEVSGHYDWLIACSTETSRGLRLPIAELAQVAQKLNARLMLDATASIGLEPDHELADVLAYSSCKGLFGLTGAAFIAFHEGPTQTVDSFYLSLATHADKKVTGPYHAIASLADVLPHHTDYRESVVVNKARFLHRMSNWLTQDATHQPLLCTHVNGQIRANDSRAVLYHPRGGEGGSVVCHLGEAHLGKLARGDLLDTLSIEPEEKEKLK